MQGRYINNTTRFGLSQDGYEYAFRNYFTDNVDQLPTITPYVYNTSLVLYSYDNGIATVDWGDGSVENFPFIELTNGRYLCAFRSLTSESYWGQGNDWTLGNGLDGKPVIPYPNHKYTDNGTHKISITCNNKVYSFNSNRNKMPLFPIIEAPDLEELYVQFPSYVKEIPIDRIGKMSKLKALTLSYLGSKLEVIPSTIFELKELEKIDFSGVFNLQNADSANLRLIKNLTKLTNLNLRSCNIETYIKEFNDLPHLVELNLSTSIDGAPKYNEVYNINQKIKRYTQFYDAGNFRTEWDNLSGKLPQNIEILTCWNAPALRVDVLPEYLKEMRAMSLIEFGNSLTSQLRVDQFVNSFYALVTGWDQLTMDSLAKDGLRNQFYRLTVNAYNAVFPYDYRPSGVYKAPSGFIENSVNGNPSTPMEMIYVLTKNYKQTWTIKPETKLASERSITNIPDGHYLDNSVIYSEKDPIFNNNIKPKDYENNNYEY